MTWRQSPVGRRSSVRVVLASLLLAVGSAWAVPVAPTLPLQGVLRTAAGGPVTDGTYVITVRLYDAETGGATLWQETMPGVNVVGGLFLTTLGQTVPLPATLTQGNAPAWLGVQVGVEPELPRTALGYVPRALWADVAGTAQALACDGCVNGAALANGAVTADKVAFPYAGAATAGGAATAADSAKSALTADVAKDLQCTGCVAWSELGADVGTTLVSTFLSQSGGSVSGSLNVTETLTVGQVLDLSAAVVLGARLGANNAACDVAHAGGLTYANGRISVCDGVGWKKLTFCGEQCVDPAKVTCGNAIPDQCGDTGVCSGKGTLCANAGEQCVTNGATAACVAVPTSCLAIAATKAGQPDAAFLIDPDGVGGEPPITAWCDLNSTTAIDNTKGGWTLVMKVDGSKDTFLYDSPLWTNKVAYNAASPLFDSNELKSSAFWTLKFTSIRILMANGAGGALTAPGQEIQADGRSLYDIFASGAYRPTYLGRSGWKALLPNMALQYNCSLEGFNVRPQLNTASSSVFPRVRLGMLGNDGTDCISVDSWIGVGEQGNGCFSQAVQHATGNACSQNCGGCDGALNSNLSAFAYIYVR